MKNVALLAFASFVLACSLNPAVDKFSSYKKISTIYSADLFWILRPTKYYATTIQYEPKGIAKEKIMQMRKLAQEAVASYKQANK